MMIADVVIHIPQGLGAEERRELEDELRGMEGVVAPRFGPTTPHLLLVAYDPQKTDSGTLLGQMAMQGYAASLVGM